MALMSDAYEVTADHRMVLKAARNGVPPNVKLDGAYKFVDDLYELIPRGAPSLIDCISLTVEGKGIEIPSSAIFMGKVKIVNKSGAAKAVLKPGSYSNQEISL